MTHELQGDEKQLFNCSRPQGWTLSLAEREVKWSDQDEAGRVRSGGVGSNLRGFTGVTNNNNLKFSSEDATLEAFNKLQHPNTASNQSS